MEKEELLAHFQKQVELNLRPQFLYQYRSINNFLFDSIDNNQLFLCNPFEFNDPFECRFAEIRVTTAHLNSFIRFLKEEGLFEKYLSNLNSSINPRVQILHNFFESIKTMGISCFTTKADNALMWSHYANKHTGVCLEFDTLEDINLFKDLYKVKYRNKRPAYNYLKSPLEIYDFFSKKSRIWEYENEYRVIKQQMGLHQFEKASLKRVIFGCNITTRSRNKVLKRLIGKGYDCKPFITSTSSTSYAINIKPL